ncbi:MAG: glycosyltransferase [Actinomycetes bacterium]
MRIALVSPGFHSYHRSIQFGLEQLGHTVFVVLYDERIGLKGKISGKVSLDLARKLGADTVAREMRLTTARVAAEVATLRFDLLLVIKGDVLDPQFVADTGRSGARTVLWLYDELRRTAHRNDGIAAYDLVASYSPNDVGELTGQGIEARLVPLAFDERLAVAGIDRGSGPDVVFVGARYGRREELLVAADRAGLSVRAYGRDWSRNPRDRARTLNWKRPPIPSNGDLDREQAARVMQEAVSVLNVHGDQDGFTMRTFEAAGVGGLQLVDRDDVAAFYQPGAEVLVFRDEAEIVDHVHRARREPGWAQGVRVAASARTLAEHTFRHRCADLVDLC